MNLLADEGVEQQIVDRIREDGHSVLYLEAVLATVTPVAKHVAWGTAGDRRQAAIGT